MVREFINYIFVTLRKNNCVYSLELYVFDFQMADLVFYDLELLASVFASVGFSTWRRLDGMFAENGISRPSAWFVRRRVGPLFDCYGSTCVMTQTLLSCSRCVGVVHRWPRCRLPTALGKRRRQRNIIGENALWSRHRRFWGCCLTCSKESACWYGGDSEPCGDENN